MRLKQETSSGLVQWMKLITKKKFEPESPRKLEIVPPKKREKQAYSGLAHYEGALRCPLEEASKSSH